MMDTGEYMAQSATLRAINSVIMGVDEAEMQRFIDACERADTLGPFLDPTAWMQGGTNVRAIADSARALLEHRRALARIASR